MADEMTDSLQFRYHETTTTTFRAPGAGDRRTPRRCRRMGAKASSTRSYGTLLAKTWMFKAAEQQLEQIIAGDNRALNAFVDAMTPVIQSRVSRCLLRGNPRDLRQDVKDHTQEVFLHLFSDGAKALQQWREEGGLSLANFVGLIAERRTISALRSGRRNPWREDTPLDDQHEKARAVSGPDEQVARSDSLAMLFELLQERLSPLGWRLFWLLYVEEKTVNEVRAATGLKADAVYAWRSRLRRTARECQKQLDSETASATRRTGH